MTQINAWSFCMTNLGNRQWVLFYFPLPLYHICQWLQWCNTTSAVSSRCSFFLWKSAPNPFIGSLHGFLRKQLVTVLGPTCLCRLYYVLGLSRVLWCCAEAVLSLRAELLAAGTISLLQAGTETHSLGSEQNPGDFDVGGSLTSLEGRCASTFEDLVIFPKLSRRLWQN